eukprot:g5568.t1
MLRGRRWTAPAVQAGLHGSSDESESEDQSSDDAGSGKHKKKGRRSIFGRRRSSAKGSSGKDGKGKDGKGGEKLPPTIEEGSAEGEGKGDDKKKKRRFSLMGRRGSTSKAEDEEAEAARRAAEAAAKKKAAEEAAEKKKADEEARLVALQGSLDEVVEPTRAEREQMVDLLFMEQEQLDLRRRELQRGQLWLIGVHLTEKNCLHSLYLANNDLGPWGLAQLAKGLATNRSLVTLDLEDCRAVHSTPRAPAGRDGHWRHAFPRKKGWKKEEPTPPSADPIDSTGLKRLCEALQTNQKLAYLNLRWNHIGHEGAVIVADLMAANMNITHLYLGHNGIDNPGLERLAKTLASQIERMESFPQLLEELLS